jgi:hypothetical protein
LKDLGKDRRIILKRIVRKRDGGMDWIVIAQNRERGRAIVNAVMKIMVPR